MSQARAKPLLESERALTEEILHLADTMEREDLASSIRKSMESVQSVAEAVDRYPSPLDSQTLGERERNIQTLLEKLTRQNSFSIEMVIPTRAAVAHALLMARLNFFRLLRRVTEQMVPNNDRLLHLRHAADERVAECIEVRATEEILKAIVCRKEDSHVLRERAARGLLHLWDAAGAADIARQLPVLSATWEARRRVRVALGTLLGASELYSLLAEGCDPRFLDFLTRSDCSSEEISAFKEFLFGLSTEELSAVESGISNRIVSPLSLAEEGVLSPTQLAGVFQAGDEAERFFHFFMKRHLLATYRDQMHLPGPKKTAEQYVLGHYLLEHWESFS